MTPPPAARLVLEATYKGETTAVPFTAEVGQELRLGREGRRPPGHPESRPDHESDLVFRADDSVSRFQATVVWGGSRLAVRRNPRSQNPVRFFDPADPAADPQGRPEGEVAVGGQFVIGMTRFTLRRDDGPVERTRTAADLERVVFPDPAARLDALAALPAVIDSAPDPARLADELLDVVLRGVPRAKAAALVEFAPDRPTADRVCVVGVRSRSGDGRDFKLSRQLVERAVGGFEPVAYVWPVAAGADTPTQAAGINWTVCVRLPGARNEGLYVAGRSPEIRPETAGLLDPDLKFAKLAGDVYAKLRDLWESQQREQFLSRLVSPPVRAALAGKPLDELTAPREVPNTTVLFCDLRGFTKMVEKKAGDLSGAWEELSQALDVMTDAITGQDGVVGDFQGDAVMAFWGWPLSQHDQVERAARAALAIRKRFVALRPAHPLAKWVAESGGFPCGIGLAHGPAVAGRLGSADQVKIGVFGPVVNRAARLEAATKKLRVPILIDEAVLGGLAGLAGSRTWCRTRRIARVLPQGLQAPVLIGELLPPDGEAGPNLREEHRKRYEAGLDRFLAGDWAAYRRVLDDFPADGPAELLARFAAAQTPPGSPPAGWDGGIPVEK